MTSAITQTPTSDSTQREARTESGPKMRMLVVSVDEGLGPGPSGDTRGSEEAYLNARVGLYRVLSLLGDPVDDSLDAFPLPALEEYCELIASKANTDGAVRWSFVPVMDAHVS